jgi:hypothetical protein
MSHFTSVRTRLADREALIKGLADLGFANVESHDEPQHLMGFQGDRRQQTAEVIIRRQYVGRMSNDIGFKLGPDGCFEAIISQFDRTKYHSQWLGSLCQRSAYHSTCAKLVEQGFDLVSQEQTQDGHVHMTLRRMV